MKPQRAIKLELEELTFPKCAQVKLDGIRCIVKEGVVYTRSLKPVRNKHVQYLFGREEYNGFDGELIVGEPTHPDVYKRSNSGVMSTEGTPDVRFYVFDKWDMPEKTFKERFEWLEESFEWTTDNSLVLVATDTLYSVEEVKERFKVLVDEGWEGLMLRNPDSLYKFGDSGKKLQQIIKLKPFIDDEAVIVDFEELMSNQNEAETNALGRTQRSVCKDGLVPMDTLGALVLCFEGVTFKCGTGFSEEDRKYLWSIRRSLEGKLVKFRYSGFASKGRPRFPVFLGLRDKDDLAI